MFQIYLELKLIETKCVFNNLRIRGSWHKLEMGTLVWGMRARGKRALGMMARGKWAWDIAALGKLGKRQRQPMQRE
jgi:hypothetical protein